MPPQRRIEEHVPRLQFSDLRRSEGRGEAGMPAQIGGGRIDHADDLSPRRRRERPGIQVCRLIGREQREAAPPGHDAFYVLAPVPNLAGGQDWARLAEPYRQRIAARLEASVLPGLGASVVTSRVTTPQDFADDFLSVRGSGFGLEPVLTQSAWFRPHNRSEEVENLYLVGAGTHPGAGLPGVLSSARVLDSLVPDARHLRRRA